MPHADPPRQDARTDALVALCVRLPWAIIGTMTAVASLCGAVLLVVLWYTSRCELWGMVLGASVLGGAGVYMSACSRALWRLSATHIREVRALRRAARDDEAMLPGGLTLSAPSDGAGGLSLHSPGALSPHEETRTP